jgi:methyl-CpG-binding domain protein 4
MMNADPILLAKILKPLGLYNRRSKSMIRFSKEYLNSEWQLPSELYGCGKYADDCYKVFCLGNWQDVNPTDHALNDYVDWMKSQKVSNA